jgi:hypothetical protein
VVVVDHLDKGANLGALGERLLVHLARDLRRGRGRGAVRRDLEMGAVDGGRKKGHHFLEICAAYLLGVPVNASNNAVSELVLALPDYVVEIRSEDALQTEEAAHGAEGGDGEEGRETGKALTA